MLNSITYEQNERLILRCLKNHLSLYLDYFNPIRDHITAGIIKNFTVRLKITGIQDWQAYFSLLIYSERQEINF